MAIYEYVALQSWAGQEVRNVHHYDSGGVLLTAADHQAAVDDARVEWSASWAPQAATNWAIRGYHVRRVDVAGFIGIDFLFTSGPVAGTNVAQMEASQVAMLVSGTGETTPPNRTRTYLAGLTESSIQSDGTVLLATATAGETLMDNLILLSTPAGFINFVSARRDPVSGLVTAFNLVDSFSSSRVPATQRRRRLGVGI